MNDKILENKVKNKDKINSVEKFTHLPFLKLNINEDLSFENNITKNSNEIKNETSRLLSKYELDLLQKNNELIYSDKNKDSELPIKKKYKLFNIKNIMNNSYKKENLKKIKEFKLSSIKEKYLSLVKKYQFKNIIKKKIHIDDSNSGLSLSTPNILEDNKTLKKTCSNKLINNYKGLYFKEKEINEPNSKIYKIEEKFYESKLNSKNIIKNITKYNKRKQGEEKEIKQYLNRSAKSIKKFEKIIMHKNKDIIKENKEKIIKKKSKINYYKLFEPKINNDPLKKFKLSKNKDSNQIWLKRSTANLLIYGQCFNLMDDGQFFKYRKNFLNELPVLEKDANIKYIDNSERRISDGKNIEKNNKIINGLIENNKILYRNVYRKVSEI